MELSDKKILVTGGGGFLGKHIIKKLLERGVPREHIFSPTAKELDLRVHNNCIKAVAGIDLVIHTAGITGNVELHISKPADIFYENLIMGVELIEAAHQAGVEKFITIGSAAEYPDNARIPFREEDLWIGQVEPIHAPYTVAKKMLLVQAQAYRKQYGFDTAHILITNMYGPGEHDDGGPIPALIRRFGEAKKQNVLSVEVWGSGYATRDFIYVDDAAEGILLVAEKYNKEEPLNLGSGFEISIKDLAELIKKLMGYEGKLVFDLSKPEGQQRRFLDSSRAGKELGFKAVTDFHKGLYQTIKYHGF